MPTIEFETFIRDGAIHIPPEYRQRFKNRVKVILLSEESEDTGANLIDELLLNPLHIKGFRPLTRAKVYER